MSDVSCEREQAVHCGAGRYGPSRKEVSLSKTAQKVKPSIILLSQHEAPVPMQSGEGGQG